MLKRLLLSLILCLFTVTSLFAVDMDTIFKNSLAKIEILKKQGISCNIKSVTKEKVEEESESEKNKSDETEKNKVNNDNNAKLYMKGEKIKLDLDADEKRVVILIDSENIYFYIEEEKIIIKTKMDTENIKKPFFDFVQEKMFELNFVGRSLKNGYTCQVFKAKDDSKDMEYYLTDKYGLPTYIKEKDTEINITDFKIGGISDNLFVLPEDTNINIIDVPSFSMQNVFKGMQ